MQIFSLDACFIFLSFLCIHAITMRITSDLYYEVLYVQNTDLYISQCYEIYDAA